MMAHKELDRVSGVETTGHEWDGLKELNNPLPKWWLYLFYACIIWSVGYYFFYPSWPLVQSYTTGLLNHSQRLEALDVTAAGAKARLANATGLADATVAQIKADPKLLEFAMANGKAAFGDNCSPCHGSGATGGPGFPSLQDDDWLWGGKLDDIYQTIRFGIRSTPSDTRTSQMPAFGKDGVLKKDEIEQVADFVLSLSDPAVKGADKGKQIFADNCAACHGDAGKGNQELGAPNLTDKIWLYGGTKAAIVAQVTNPQHGVMPAWEGRLDPITIKSLAVYIHSLGGGK
ncbi:cytochrome-c oxidase, cbb3-type subunit III [Methyloraptor flagellatus]|uniref:Cbb3-type cytochrome c oxidase subunit n=1 Tax=Methyloraptor flagellatus TaxID=3162530 RepID=A0AAU7XFG9_9HYPH